MSRGECRSDRRAPSRILPNRTNRQRTVSLLALIVGDARLRLNLQNGMPVKYLRTHVAKAKAERIPSLVSGAASMSMVLWVSVPQYNES